MPDRQIENKDFGFTTTLVDVEGDYLEEFSENFVRGYLRNSSENGHYYSLGKYTFPAGFKGAFQYSAGGSWQPPYPGTLVLRKRGGQMIPMKYAVVLFIGGMLMVMGVRNLPQSDKSLGE